LKIFCIILILNIFLGTLNSFAEEIKVLYFKRPPYIYAEENNFIHGLVGTPARKAFENSNLPHKFIEIPPKRQLIMIKANQKKLCGLGWFKNKEREKFGKYTLPIYRDSMFVALTHSHNSKLKNKHSVEDLFKDKDLVLLMKSSFSYGKYLDKMIQKFKPNVNVVACDISQMFLMLLAGRCDYFFVSYEEALNLIIQNDQPFENFNMIFPKNGNKGELRYIFCSKKVSDEEINKLNDWIKQNLKK
jgi:uncharacterized protein (TIGR02285 family)